VVSSVRRRAKIGALLLAGSLALAGAGCGGSDEAETSSVDAWASGFCTALTSWTDELQQIGNEFNDPSSLNEDSIQDAVASVSDATDAFVDDVRALGSPDTESGDEVESAVDELADTLESSKADIEDAADGISGLTDLPGAVTAIGSALTAMGTAMQGAVTAIEDADVGGELETAFEQSDACNDITS
jgi:methyl-accepting chemotaxis protein